MQQLPPDYLLPSQTQPPNGEAQQYQQQMMELLELLQAERSKSKVLGSQLSRMTGAQSHLQVHRKLFNAYQSCDLAPDFHADLSE